ncbi:MAG: HAD family hydrolase [Alphaproteobacteria bacterium]|jgi:phosphoglycolate phosphatase|nr:HAD family hydrolase [Alphaproteobacteria bacterium]
MTFKAIAFDFDGVILESVSIKTEAMATLFAEHKEHLDAIIAIHETHAGFSRYIKFDMIYRDVLKISLAPEVRAELGRTLSDLVLEKVLACPFVAGALEFLKAHHEATPLFVISGTPDEELLTITSERELAPYFSGVYGSNRGKPEILAAIMAERDWEPRDLVFIGDGLTDFDAAKETGNPFIGRVPETHASPFPNATLTISDLTGLDQALKTLCA